MGKTFPYNYIYLGEREWWGGTQPFGMTVADRRQHLYVVGKTGTGKTTLLRKLIRTEITTGRGVGLIDPHGDLAREVIADIPHSRTKDLMYFNPADLEHPIGLNLLANVPLDRRHLVASGIVAVFKHIWTDSWGARTEYILYNTVAALLDYPGSTMLGIPKMLADSGYRSTVVKHITDPVVRQFWTQEFARYDPRFMTEAISPIQNKVGRFLSAAPLRNILGQEHNRIDFRHIIDHNRIFIANLSKGELGEDKANFLGSFLVSALQLAAMERATVPEDKRTDFLLAIDEFHNFTTDSFASLLSEARKYRLALVCAHQYLAQLLPATLSAVFGNVGSLIAFRVGQADAEVLAREFEGEFTADELTGLARGEVRVRLVSDGQTLKPFRAYTWAGGYPRTQRLQKLIRVSRERFSRRRTKVEQEIAWFLGVRPKRE